MSTSDHRLMFGTSISNNSQIILLQIMAYLESFANCEGIFRKSGSKQRIDQLVRDLREKDFQQILLSEKYKPHDYASMLKQYFSELVEPLLLKRHLYAYLQTAGTTRSIASYILRLSQCDIQGWSLSSFCFLLFFSQLLHVSLHVHVAV